MSLETVAGGRGKRVKAFGLETNYLEAGSGEPLLLLHGSGPGVSAWTNWRRVMPAFAEKFHVLAPDLAGFGYTERSMISHTTSRTGASIYWASLTPLNSALCMWWAIHSVAHWRSRWRPGFQSGSNASV